MKKNEIKDLNEKFLTKLPLSAEVRKYQEPVMSKPPLLVDQWVKVVDNSQCGNHPTENRLLQCGDMIQISAIDFQRKQVDYVVHLKDGSGDGVNTILFSDFEPWIPEDGDEVRIQRLIGVADYGTSFNFAPRSQTLPSPAELKVNDVIRVRGPYLEGTMLECLGGTKILLGHNGIRYHTKDSGVMWLWLNQLRPMSCGLVETAEPPKFKPCNCDMTTLMNTGCVCGSVPKFESPWGW